MLVDEAIVRVAADVNLLTFIPSFSINLAILRLT
jgi:hypothetical protein